MNSTKLRGASILGALQVNVRLMVCASEITFSTLNLHGSYQTGGVYHKEGLIEQFLHHIKYTYFVLLKYMSPQRRLAKSTGENAPPGTKRQIYQINQIWQNCYEVRNQPNLAELL